MKNENNLGYSSDILDTESKAWSMKEVIDKLNFIKTKNFCCVKDNVKEMRRQATDWQQILAKDTSDKELLTKA